HSSRARRHRSGDAWTTLRDVVRCVHHRRPWRLRRCCPPARLRRGRLQPHHHRWRCIPGIPRGQDPARYRRTDRLKGDENMATRRTPLMAGNWKMNLDHLEATHLVQKLAWSLKDAKHDYAAVEVAVCPPFTDLRSVQTLVDADKLPIRYGSQDISAHASGAYTGEISAAMLTRLGVQYAIVGHSERRAQHGEDDALVSTKAKAALA